MKKHAATYVCAITLMALTVSMLILTVEPCNASVNPDSSFSIIWITDTQYLSERHPTYFNSLCQWIVDNKNTYNIKMVVHTGDLVEDGGNQTHWTNANQAMTILLNNAIPYCWNAGNHDYNSACWIGNQFSAFNPRLLAEKPYWISDKFDGQNTAVHFNVSGWNLLVVNLEYNANDTALSWANSVLDTYPNSPAIVATHAYLNERGTYVGRGSDESHEAWAENFRENLLEKHSNVFMTLSAHFHPASGNRTRVGDRDELMFNLQEGYGQIGGASARILTFDTAKGTINVQTYVLYANQFLKDQNNNFTLNTTFRNDFAGESIPEFPTVAVLVIVLFVFAACFVCFCKTSPLKKRLSIK